MRKLLLFLLVLSPMMLKAIDITWNSPETISTAMVDATNPQIVMDVDGNVTVVWEEGGSIKSSYQPLNGSFGSPVTISSSGSSDPKLTVDGDGNVSAIWVDSGVVKTASMPAGGSWGTVTTLSSSGASSPIIKTNSAGDLVAVWVRAGFIEAKTKLILGLWSLTSTLSGANSDNPDLAVSDDGTVIAVWHTITSGFDICQSSTQSAIGGIWTTPKNMVSVAAAYAFNYPKVAIDSKGNAVALAVRYQIVDGNYINVVLYGSELPKNSPAWKAIPTALNFEGKPGIGDPSALSSKISIDPAGNAVAFWTMSYDDSSFSVESSLKYFGGDWQATYQFADHNLYAFNADVATNALGSALGVYTFFDDTSITLQTTESNITGAIEYTYWSSSIQISTESGNIAPRIATILSGNEIFAACAWVSYDGSNQVVQVATGSKEVIDPPSNLMITEGDADFGAYLDHYNTVSWTASSSPNIVQYAIFRNGILFMVVGPDVFEVEEHNVDPDAPLTYGVTALDSDLTQSVIVNVSTP